MILNTVLTLIIVLYIIYINYERNYNDIPNIITNIINNKFFRILMLLFICYFMTNSNNKNKLLSQNIAILLSIAYLLTILYSLKKIKNENFKSFNNAPVVENLNNLPCGSYPPTNLSQYIPEPYRPNDSMLSSGEPDPISKCGQDFRSCPPAPFADSGIAYKFNMA